MAVFSGGAPLSLAEIDIRYRGNYCLLYQGEFWLNIPEDSRLHTRRRENLKFLVQSGNLFGIVLIRCLIF
jgi:hypothetical protein